MKVFTITKADPMGEAGEFGQSFWAEVEGSDLPIMFSKKGIKEIPAGSQLVAEEHVEKTSKKGNAYLFLKKVKLELALPDKTSEDGSNDVMDKLNAMHGDIKILILKVRQLAGVEDEPTDPDPPEQWDGDTMPEDFLEK